MNFKEWVKEELIVAFSEMECDEVFKEFLQDSIYELLDYSIEDWIFIWNEYCISNNLFEYDLIRSSDEVKDELNDILIKGTLEDVFDLIEDIDIGRLNNGECYYHITNYGFKEFESEYEIITDFIDFSGLFQYIYDYFVDDESDEELDDLLDNWDIDSILKYCRLW